jgi:hypothetical protein
VGSNKLRMSTLLRPVLLLAECLELLRGDACTSCRQRG